MVHDQVFKSSTTAPSRISKQPGGHPLNAANAHRHTCRLAAAQPATHNHDDLLFLSDKHTKETYTSSHCTTTAAAARPPRDPLPARCKCWQNWQQQRCFLQCLVVIVLMWSVDAASTCSPHARVQTANRGTCCCNAAPLLTASTGRHAALSSTLQGHV